jgi:hypothetical protein
LHLLDDDLRVSFGAGAADVSYRYYGTGFAVNALGLSVELRQKGTAYFASGSWRIWRNLYLGFGVLRGEVETQPRVVVDPNLDRPGFDALLNVDLGALMVPL